MELMFLSQESTLFPSEQVPETEQEPEKHKEQQVEAHEAQELENQLEA